MDEKQIMLETLRKKSENSTLEVIFKEKNKDTEWIISRGRISTIGSDGYPVYYCRSLRDIQFLVAQKDIPLNRAIEIRVIEVKGGESLSLENLFLFQEAESFADLQNIDLLEK